MSGAVWENLSALPPLDEGQVNVLRFSLDRSDDEVSSLAKVLDAVEKKRAARFKRVLHQKRFTVGRAVLRILLGYYMGQSPASIKFRYGTHGKPALALSDAVCPLQFNLSHSDAEALCAITWECPLGVDIEVWKDRVSVRAIADRFFSPEESSYLAACSDEARIPAFYHLWTAKEALLKGVGGGLTIPLDRCCFLLGQEPLGLSFVELPLLKEADWAVYPIPPIVGFSGALAVAGKEATPRYYVCNFALKLPQC